ncbi:hypothetical protein L228DRAFT_265216 [Xylona heveae TC161]|uniref:DUF7707 domain-containing protein n=1 Tax=Xylona heveae (strain CBS 132557 / TC161) TaxID=1328760 RepID=A0A165K0S4_XYLHT|nr:hypothetical protein L228DRAFT_265216 [Xylona heveae TC161]KZF26861.1 hypothetical protein L228DRAFT_265216 [Xylona heveae TC161]
MRSFSALFVASAAFAGFASALGNQTIDPNSVDLSTRNSWCLSENNNCPLLCGGSGDVQTLSCDGNTLQYQCVCTNGSSPDVAAYTGTLPFFICQEYVSQCITNHPNDLDGQTACRKDNPCGTLDPTKVQAASPSSSSSSSVSASATSASSTSSTPSATSATATPSATQKAHNAAAGLNVNYATAIFGAALLAACGAFL